MKIKSKPSIIVFEVNDNNRSQMEYGKHACDKYLNDFSDFIKSLGYDVELNAFLGKLKIEGHEFNVNTDNASYMSKNLYRREVTVRKPENRYILIEKGYKKNLLKIQFNKEYDGNKIRKKINEEINRLNELIKNTIDRETANLNNVTMIAKKYIDAGMKELVNSVSVSNSVINIYTEELALGFDFSSGVLKSALVHQKRYNDESESENIFSDLEKISMDIKNISKIVKENPMPVELSEWSTVQSSGSYIFKTLEYNKY